MSSAGSESRQSGALPNGWDVARLGDVASFRTGPFGSALHKSDYVIDGIPIINPMHIIDGRLAPSASMTVTEPAAKRLGEFRLRPGEIVIGRRGDMGRCAVVAEEHAGWLCGTGSMIVCPGPRMDPGFLQLVLASPTVVSAIEAASVGSTMVNLNQGTLAGLAIQAPPRNEQAAIGQAIADADSSLAKLDQLIAKKRDLKQAAMQQLLTGRRRLPGFARQWTRRTLGTVLTICHGKSQRDVESPDGPFPILATGGQIGTASSWIYDKPSVLIGRKGTIDRPQYVEAPFWTVDTLFYSAMKGAHCAKFFYYRFCLIDWSKYNEASGVPSLNARTIEAIEVDCPEPPEQLAIAKILSDMDTDLAALEAQREKARQLKQGMMQALLTGRIRLV